MQYSKARKIRKQLGAKCPCVIYWQRRKLHDPRCNWEWQWTLFARNGRVQDASSESFSSERNATANYNGTYRLMGKLGRFWPGAKNAGHYIEGR